MTTHKKVLIIIFLIIAIILISFMVVRLNIEKDKKFNIVLISVDTLRPDHMSLYGYDKKTTPNIDAWSKKAVVFTNMRTVVPATYPSFAAFMTGKNQFESGIYNNLGVVDGKLVKGGHKIPASTQTLAEIAKDKDYKTAAFVTNHLLDAELTNINKGFDEYTILASFAQDKKEYDLVSKKVSHWIKENTKHPFFLWVHFIAPHSTYMPKEQYACIHNKKYCNEINERGLENLEKERAQFQYCQVDSLPKEQINKFETLYDGEISWDDENVGQIIRSIKNNNLNESTIIVFYADHGEGFDHNYYFTHSAVLYDSALRVPFIIQDPRLKPGVITDNITNKDGFYVLKELLNNKITDNSGMIDTVNNLVDDTKEIFFSNTERSKYAVIKDNYKFIYSLARYSCLYENATSELYDIKKDPLEKTNLVEKNKNQAAILKEKLLNHMKKYSLTVPVDYKDSDFVGDEKRDQIIEELRSLGY